MSSTSQIFISGANMVSKYSQGSENQLGNIFYLYFGRQILTSIFNSILTFEVKILWAIQKNYEITLDEVKCSSGDWSSCSYSTSPDTGKWYCGHDDDVFLACTRK